MQWATVCLAHSASHSAKSMLSLALLLVLVLVVLWSRDALGPGGGAGLGRSMCCRKSPRGGHQDLDVSEEEVVGDQL